ncbi:MAG: carboxymuconolactone decarboxylase family protein [Betaproteobacteria bacterium]|nr:carboxymuconolactone decarboxylase family protein [Betaproteobacteria bacterium]
MTCWPSRGEIPCATMREPTSPAPPTPEVMMRIGFAGKVCAGAAVTPAKNAAATNGQKMSLCMTEPERGAGSGKAAIESCARAPCNRRCYTRRVCNRRLNMKPRVWGNEPTPDTPTTRAYPPDVNRDSSSRLPPVRREDLDETGQRAYDAMTAEGSKLRASLRGPTGFWLHLPEVIEHVRELNWSLRNREFGLARPLRELTILVTARGNDCQKEWTAHEMHALDAGLDPELIDIIKDRKPLDGVAETEAAIIVFGRELFGAKKVSSATYAQALKVLGQRRLVHMVALMSNYTMTSVIFAALDQQVAPDQVPLLPLP